MPQHRLREGAASLPWHSSHMTTESTLNTVVDPGFYKEMEARKVWMARR